MRLKRVFLYCLFWALLPLLIVYIYLAYSVFIADSEMWSVNLGYHFLSEWSQPWVYSRLLFYVPLWLIQLFSDQAVINLYLARSLMLVNTLVLFFVLYQMTRDKRLLESKSFNWFFVFTTVILLSNTTFLNQGFRIRSDLIATVLALISVYYFKIKKLRTWQADIFFFILPVLATPKAAVYCIAFLAFKPWQTFWSQKFLRYAILIFALLGTAGFLFLNQDSLVFFKRAIFDHRNSPIYFSFDAFYHVFKSIKYNPLFYFLLVGCMIEKVFPNREATEEDLSWRNYDNFCLLLFCIFLFLPEKVPFLLASILPFFSIMIARKSMSWFKSFNLSSAIILTSVFFLQTWNVARWTLDNLSNNNNSKQLTTIANFQNVLTSNEVPSYIDGFGMVPAKDQYRIFLGPNNYESAQSVLQLIRSPQPPEILVFTAALKSIPFKLNSILDKKYIPFEHGFFVRAFDFSKMSLNEMQDFLNRNSTGPKGLNRVLTVELNTSKNGKLESIQRIKLTIEELMRKTNGIVKSRGNSLKKNKTFTEIGMVSVYSDLKVSNGESFEELFKFDTEF